ncbi:DNA primase large subunit [Nakaseomyces bracarensis]|uniref:DNA primase large subunit n=1 Tax=Nakaseomyces bracarensis TaxID=273131 RepID=A0ABR4NQS3_9SACH
MFRQSKKRVSMRRNFGTEEVDVIQGSTEDERALYQRIYENKLSFYDVAPKGEITLEEFETWAIDRVKLLLEIESCLARNKTLAETEGIIKPLFKKFNIFNNMDNFEDRKKEYYSHFILRLCFCRSKELRDKFVRIETTLFRMRFNMLTSSDQTKFVKSLQLPSLQFIEEAEKETIATQLYQTISKDLQFNLNLADEQQRQLYFKNEKFIKLPFENVIELVGNRQVYLKDGYAYLPQFQQLNLIANEFSTKLQDELIKTYQYLPRLNEDDRLIPILNHLSSGYTIADAGSFDQFGNNQDNEINAKSVWSEDISKHYPLDVKNLFYGLKENAHLRYHGRQQLTLFLKGIGLSIDEAMKFWHDAFTRNNKMSTERFNKEYRYNIRHNYGLEGNRINYKPWDYRTILSKPRPNRGEYHGLPFRDWNRDKLTNELSKMGLTNQQITDVLDSCDRHEYTIALTKVFEMTHNVPENESMHITHPNLYFERSRQLEKKMKEMKEQKN